VREFLEKINFGDVQFTWAMGVCMAVIWMAVLACGVHSIATQPISPRQRWWWIVTITALPVLGLALYLPFSYRLQNQSGLFAFFSKQTARRKA
jgi:hypothetical protein